MFAYGVASLDALSTFTGTSAAFIDTDLARPRRVRRVRQLGTRRPCANEMAKPKAPISMPITTCLLAFRDRRVVTLSHRETWGPIGPQKSPYPMYR